MGVPAPSADDNLEWPPATLSEYLDGLAPLDDETGWLIEEDAGGIIHWIALVENIWKYGWYVSDRDQPSPVRRVKDANEALRFARKEDAEAFISLFIRFLLCPVATEHCWPASADTRRMVETPKSSAVAKPDARKAKP